MPKIIQPKRLNKNITVQSYWQIRNKQKQIKKQIPYQAYRQDEVTRRYRYLKPTEQAKLFNPLTYFFKRDKEQVIEDEQYASNFKDKQSTHVTQFLSSVRFRVSGPLVRIKKYIYGLKSIIYNHQTILEALTTNLQCEDAWILTQAMIKDTKGESFNFWMKQGLKNLAYQRLDQKGNLVSIYQSFFHQGRFQNLFQTLSVFMEANYDKIMENINEFFGIMNKYFFNHTNKYIRKFAMKSVSYILNNLSLEQNLNLIFHIVLNGNISQNKNQIPIGQLLLNRHKAVKGCLSSVQISKVVQTLKQIPLFLIKSFQKQFIQSEMSSQQNSFKSELKCQMQNLLIDYIAGVLDLLETKFGRIEQGQNSNEILFDLNYCIKAFISVQQKSESNIAQTTLIQAFSKYLQNCDQKRFLTHNQKHQTYINETFKIILSYLQTSTIKCLEKENLEKSKQNNELNNNTNTAYQISKLLGLIFKSSPKQSSMMIISKGITYFCKKLNIDQAYELMQKIYQSQIAQSLDHNQSKSLGQFIFMSFSKFIKSYFDNQIENQEVISQFLYTICLVLKKIRFSNSLNLSYLNLNTANLLKKASQITKITEFILFCRLVSLINIESENNKGFNFQLTKTIEKTFKNLISPFSESLYSLVNQDKQQNSSSLFSYNNHIKNLLRYSHHEVEWVSVAFNLQDCFKQILKKISAGKQVKQQSWVWSELSLNRILKIDQSLDLDTIFRNHLNLLQSRNRAARKTILQRIHQLWSASEDQKLKSILERIINIDSDDIDLSNQRDIKKQFSLLEQDLSQIKKQSQSTQKIINLLTNWILGFSFTGFKLVNQSVVSFTKIILDSYPEITSKIIFPFLQYYIYRHSRQFQFDTTQNQVFVLRTPKKVQNQFNQIKNNQIFYHLMKEDFSIQDQITIEWIGLERIGQALGQAKTFKNNNKQIKQHLEKYLQQYFEIQFVRKNKVLSSHKANQEAPNSHLILPPKTRFLAVMLKLCTNSYLPPYECLHYLTAEYLSLQSVHEIKKNRWQALWVKKLKGNKSRQQISDTVNTSIQLQKMSISQQHLYAHFLWKQIIQSNQQKRRVLFQHIRDRISAIIPYLFQNLLFKQMLYLNNYKQYFSSALLNKQLINQLKEKLLLENKKTLLNLMYILKAMVNVFKNFLRNSEHMANVVIVLRCLIHAVYTDKEANLNHSKDNQLPNQQHNAQEQPLGQHQNQQQEQHEEDNQDQDKQQNQEEQKLNKKNSNFVLYKLHRKQLYKLLTEIFTHYSLEYEQAESILTELSNSYLHSQAFNFKSQIEHNQKTKNIFSRVAYGTINSVPGILILLKVISNQKFYHNLLLKFGILDLIATIIDITDYNISLQDNNNEENIIEESQEVVKKKQSNPHAIKQCLDILSNIFTLNQDQNSQAKMEVQVSHQTYHLKLNHMKWKNSLEYLLRAINHYFLYSRNLNQTSLSTKNGNIELEYYSNENKQNLNSIKNNKNRSKNDQIHKHQHQGKNLDILWQIVGKIVLLKVQNHNQKHQVLLGSEWEQIFWKEINKIVKVKQFKQKQHHKLFKIVQIALIYFDQQISKSNTNSFSKKVQIQSFLCKIISVLPHISQLSQRVKLTRLIHDGIFETSQRQNITLIDEQAIKIVSQINSVKRNGLNIEIDFDLFFAAINKYSQDNTKLKKSQEMIDQNKKELNLLSHQYIIYNLLPYLTSEELSVRKAIRQALNSFLVRISVHLKQFQSQTLKVYNSILRLLIQQLKRNQVDNVFWSIISCIGLFVRFQVKFQSKFEKLFDNQAIYSKFLTNLIKITTDSEPPNTYQSESEQDFFHMIGSISQGNKMKALKMLKQHCIKLKSEENLSIFKQQQKGSCLPHPLSWLLPTLQHLILPIKHFTNQHQYNIQGNLTSTLTHISLQIYEVIISFARQSLIKRQLKRLSTKIKFNESQRITDDGLKRNILVIKIITSIVEGIDSLEKCTGKIKKYVQDYGFDEFHSKLIINARTLNQDAEQSDEQENKQRDQKKKVEFGENLQQLQSQEAINRNFMMFDKKLMTMEEKQNQSSNSINNAALIKFLKLHVLIPLKLMLFYQNKSSKQAKQEQDKSRMMISVAITKLLIKFPMDMFLFEFQKILSKICRLLKKRKQQIRQNGRKSLCQIAKIVGPQMLYAIVLELKFHLRDNFQKHIFNFTTYEIIQSISPLKQGDIDYCLPLILPMVIDQMFGQANQQKKMVEANQVPVLNMQTKKKKGHELLILLSKQISVERIRYMIDYLEKFLKDYLNSEVNLSKYEMLLNYLTNGLGNNEEFISQQNAGIFGQILCDSMYELRKQIKIYNFEEQKNKIIHESTIKFNTDKTKKVGKQSLLLQAQAGKNGSIFKKMSKQVYEKRNQEIIINSLVQFYLTLGSLLIKKQVICLKTLEQNKQLTSNFIKIVQFVFECMDHRDNRIVSKCMRFLHQALIWNYDKSTSEELKQSTKSLRKKVSRKILLFVQKLTSTDEQLLKQSFVILIDLFSQVSITKQFLPSIIAIIKLHTNNQNDQANIPEPYRLFKLIIYKLPQAIYDPLVYQMYEMVRINIVNSNIRQIRDVCRQIASTYVRNKEFLETSIEMGPKQKHQNNKNNKSKQNIQKNVDHQYLIRIKKQLNFYLSNLDCKYEQNQLLVLQILEELINNRTKAQIQQISQLILLTLSTSLINGNEHGDKIRSIFQHVLSIIDKNKIYELIEKSIVWIQQPRQKSMIRQCGYLLLNSIIQNKSISIDNQTVRTQYLLKKDHNSFLHSLQALLNQQISIIEDYLQSKKGQNKSKVQNKQWNSILDAIDIQQPNPYISDNKILVYCMQILAGLAQSQQYQAALKEHHVIVKVWKLLKIPKNIISTKIISFLIKINNLAVHLENQKEHIHENSKEIKKLQEQQQTQKQRHITFNYKSTVSALINNEIQKQKIHELVDKFHSEPITGEQTYLLTFNVVNNFMGKIVTKFKIMQSKVQAIYHLLKYSIIQNKEKYEIILKNEQNQNKIIDSLGKVSRNQFVSVQCKTFNEQCMNKVKETVGVSEFYRKLTKFQSERRQKKTQQKSTLAKLAVTDQKAYMDIKKKKVKTQTL